MEYDLRVNCHQCGDFHDYHRKDGDPNTVIRCDGCGKKHSDDSIYMVDLNREYARGPSGALLEDLP